jgi:hypothetical protein
MAAQLCTPKASGSRRKQVIVVIGSPVRSGLVEIRPGRATAKLWGCFSNENPRTNSFCPLRAPPAQKCTTRSAFFYASAPLAPVVVDGRRKRPHLFRVVLSHSRKGYSEVVWRQTTGSFIRCMENGFRHFGGVPKTLVIDYVAGHIIDVLFPATICARPSRKRLIP